MIDFAIEFSKISNIYLHFIAFVQGKFKIINSYSHLNTTVQKKKSFVVLNGTNTICGPLFAHDLTGNIQSVFAFDDMRIGPQVDKYIEKLNRTSKVFFLNK
jgi:hypothetical protein